LTKHEARVGGIRITYDLVVTELEIKRLF